jgi:hypothetical protein
VHHGSVVKAMVTATHRGDALAAKRPKRALADLLAANPDLDHAEARVQLAALDRARALTPRQAVTPGIYAAYLEWALDNHILTNTRRVTGLFDYPPKRG